MSNVLCIKDLMEIISLFINSIVAIVSVAILIWGICLMKEIKMRSFDSAFGFCSRLRVQLKHVKNSMGEKPSNNNDQENVFYYFADITKKPPKDSQIDLKYFTNCMEELITLLTNSDGQIPLTENMDKNIDALYEKILFYSKYPPPANKQLIKTEVVGEYEYMDKLLKDIVDEVSKERRKMLEKITKNKKCKK